MALRWLEGFQGCRNAAVFARVYTDVAGGIGTTFTDEFGRTQPDASALTMRTPAVVGAVANTWIIGFGFQLTAGSLNTSPSAFPHIGLRDSVGDQLRLEVVESNSSKPGGSYYKLRVMRGATELARTIDRFEGNIQNDRRIYFEFKATVRTGVNGSFELKYRKFKGGTVTATWDNPATGINTANQGTDGADRFTFAWTTGDAADRCALTDIYVCDTTGTKNNDYLGPIYIEALDPQGNGSTLNWALAGGAASIEDALNEGVATQTTLEDDKRITSDIVGDISLATMSDLSTRFDTTGIIGVQTRVYGKMETVGTRDVQFFYRKTTGTPAQIGTAILDLDTTAIVGEADTLENDPNTGTDWTVADINGIQMGVELDA